MTTSTLSIRKMEAADLDQVVELDRPNGGDKRRGFFEKRLSASGKHANAFISLVAETDGKVAGFVYAYMLDGEFGGQAPVAVLDAIGLAEEYRGHGAGMQLLEAMETEARAQKCVELRTQANWGQQDLMGFFAEVGFEMAPRTVLTRSTEGVAF